ASGCRNCSDWWMMASSLVGGMTRGPILPWDKRSPLHRAALGQSMREPQPLRSAKRNARERQRRLMGVQQIRCLDGSTLTRVLFRGVESPISWTTQGCARPHAARRVTSLTDRRAWEFADRLFVHCGRVVDLGLFAVNFGFGLTCLDAAG